MRDTNGKEYLSALRLSELLAQLHPDSRIMLNLTVMAPNGEHYEGFIDFNETGSFEKLRDD